MTIACNGVNVLSDDCVTLKFECLDRVYFRRLDAVVEGGRRVLWPHLPQDLQSGSGRRYRLGRRSGNQQNPGRKPPVA